MKFCSLIKNQIGALPFLIGNHSSGGEVIRDNPFVHEALPILIHPQVGLLLNDPQLALGIPRYLSNDPRPRNMGKGRNSHCTFFGPNLPRHADPAAVQLCTGPQEEKIPLRAGSRPVQRIVKAAVCSKHLRIIIKPCSSQNHRLGPDDICLSPFGMHHHPGYPAAFPDQTGHGTVPAHLASQCLNPF